MANYVLLSLATKPGTPLPLPSSLQGRGFGVSLFSRRMAPFRGLGRIAGIVRVISFPSGGKVVRLYHRGTGRFVDETTSGPGGEYSFENLSVNEAFYVMAFDITNGYNAVVKDHITPSAS